MDSLEKAIRTAFDKGDPLDSAYRKRVYRSALTALEKSTAANPAVTDDVAAARRDRLKEIIRSIETEFRPAVESAARTEPPPVEPPAIGIPGEDDAPPPAPASEPEAAESIAPQVEVQESAVPHAPPHQAVEPPALAVPDEVTGPLQPAASEAEPQRDAFFEVEPEAGPAPRIEVAEDAAPDVQPVRPPEVPAVELEQPATVHEAPEPSVQAHDERSEPAFDAPAAIEAAVEQELDEAPLPDMDIDIDIGDAEAPSIMPDDRDMQSPPDAIAPAVDEPAQSSGRSRRRKKEAVPKEDAPEPRSRGLLLPFIIGLAILIGGGVYLYYKYGDAPVATNENATPDESAAPALRSAQQKDSGWIPVFDASDPSTVSASAGTELEILDRDETKSLRVNAKGSKTATVTFEVGKGIMNDLADKQAVFDISARAQEGKTVEISVECDFGASGGCGRQRYEVGFSPGDYLFDVQIPKGAGSEVGKIIVRPDSAGSGAFVDISGLRATVPAAE